MKRTVGTPTEFSCKRKVGRIIGILGGGLTGLTLGSVIRDSHVLEGEREIGGLCRSVEESGFTFDPYGSHVIFSRDDNLLGFMRDSLNGNFLQRRRNTKIFFKGRLVKYPFENGLGGLPEKDRYECLMGFIESRLARELGGEERPRNLEEWFYYKFGKGIAEKYLIPYNTKIWRTPPKKMDMAWVERIPDPPLEDVVKSSLGIETEGYRHQLNFLYPRKGGIRSLVQGIAAKCHSIETDFNVRQITRTSDGFDVLATGKSKHYDRIVSTIPMPDLVSAIDDVPPSVLHASRKLRYNSLVTVMLGLEGEKINDLSWVYFPRKQDGIFYRASFPSNYSPWTVPRGCSSVMTEITCHFGDNTWSLPDDELIKSVVDDLHKNNFIDKKSVCYSRVARTKYAYIVYDLDYSKNISRVKEFLDRRGIRLCGRFGQFEYLNMDACIQRAFKLSEELL